MLSRVCPRTARRGWETSINRTDQGYVRIGELSRRVGVSHDTLRAWERRYGLLKPERTAGGFRLYTPADERRIAEMLELLKQGLAPAEAARQAVEVVGTATPAPTVGDPITALRDALEGFDQATAHGLIDYLLAQYELDVLVTHFLLPYLRDLGERWADGGVTVAQEHFASTVLRSRLLSLARDWDEGDGPRALLACPSGELHDIPLICLGLALHGRGWRVTLLGSDTPIDTVVETAAALRPDACVMSAVFTEHFDAEIDGLRSLASVTDLTLAGPGANRAVAEAVGCGVEPGDPVTVARRLTEARKPA